MRALVVTIALAATCGLASCGGGTSMGSTGPTNNPPPTNSGSNAISVGDDYYSPAATTVAIGTTVTWTWGGSQMHSVTFDDGTGSATQATGTFARGFSAAGTYAYHCKVHGTAMSGSITVQ